VSDLYRFRIALTGWNGGPGVNTLHFRNEGILASEGLDEIADAIATTYTALKGLIVPGVSMLVQPNVDVIDDSTGTLVRAESISAIAPIAASGNTTKASRANMLLAQLHTDLITDGRRVQGRVFIGPMADQGSDTDGTVPAAVRLTVSSAFDGLLDVLGARLAVWHRPKPRAAANGDSGHVQSVTCMGKPAQLRSRRD